MTSIEDQVRATLHDMADEARSAPLLQRLERERAPWWSGRPRGSRPAVVLAGAAAVLVVAIAAASLIWVRAVDRGGIVQPTVDPPKVFRLSGEESPAPGRGSMLVVLADSGAKQYEHEKPAYLLPVRGGPAVLVHESDTVATWTEHLSQDGTRIIRETDALRGSANPIEPGLEIVDLRTGAIDDLHGSSGACPALSPDNSAVAAYGDSDTWIVNVASGDLTVVGRYPERALDAQVCNALAWSPDSTQLLLPGTRGSRIVDREGRTLARLPGRAAVNASMSWSPDGRSVLLYDKEYSRYLSRVVDGDVDGGDETVLTVPGDAVRPVGWAGDRIVWLVGDVGQQSLVTTDGSGHDPQPWTRLDTRGMAVETVSWSTSLRGSARD